MTVRISCPHVDDSGACHWSRIATPEERTQAIYEFRDHYREHRPNAKIEELAE